MPSKGDIRSLLHRAGILLGLAGIGFVAHRLFVYGGEIDLGSIGAAGYVALAVLSVVYAGSNLLLAAGWRQILLRLGETPTLRWSVWAYAVSQLAKYVPGNIFHLVGRQALGAAAGLSHRALAKSALFELVIVALCTALFAPLVLAQVWPAAGPAVGVLLFAIATPAILFLGRRAFGPALARSACFYASYLAVSGIVFLGIYLVCGGQASAGEMPVIAGAYVLAWLAGLVTPGAPAGVGVREAALLVLLSGLAASPVILLAVVVGRAVTVLGDLAFYLVGGLLDARR